MKEIKRTEMKWVRTVLVVTAVVAGGSLAAGCGADSQTIDPTGGSRVTAGDPGADPPDIGDATPLPEDALLGTYDRFIAPDAPGLDIGVIEVTVPEDLEAVWGTWGPDESDAPTPPEVPVGAQPVVVWFAGSGLTITGYDVIDGEFVIVGVSVRPGENCVVAEGIEGTTFVLALADPEVVSGMATGEPRLTRTTQDC